MTGRELANYLGVKAEAGTGLITFLNDLGVVKYVGTKKSPSGKGKPSNDYRLVSTDALSDLAQKLDDYQEIPAPVFERKKATTKRTKATVVETPPDAADDLPGAVDVAAALGTDEDTSFSDVETDDESTAEFSDGEDWDDSSEDDEEFQFDDDDSPPMFLSDDDDPFEDESSI